VVNFGNDRLLHRGLTDGLCAPDLTVEVQAGLVAGLHQFLTNTIVATTPPGGIPADPIARPDDAARSLLDRVSQALRRTALPDPRRQQRGTLAEGRTSQCS
jgi:hypothetical protein